MSAREELTTLILGRTAPRAADAILASDWLAKHGAEVGERIAVAIEAHVEAQAERTGWDGRAGLLGNWVHGIRVGASIARATTMTEVG